MNPCPDIERVRLTFYIPQHRHITSSDKVDRNTFTTKPSTTTNAMNVVLPVGWEVVINDERDLLDVDPAGEKIGGDEYTGRPGAEFFHENFALLLFHVSVLKSREIN
jgi:hypothetical protein